MFNPGTGATVAGRWRVVGAPRPGGPGVFAAVDGQSARRVWLTISEGGTALHQLQSWAGELRDKRPAGVHVPTTVVGVDQGAVVAWEAEQGLSLASVRVPLDGAELMRTFRALCESVQALHALPLSPGELTRESFWRCEDGTVLLFPRPPWPEAEDPEERRDQRRMNVQLLASLYVWLRTGDDEPGQQWGLSKLEPRLAGLLRAVLSDESAARVVEPGALLSGVEFGLEAAALGETTEELSPGLPQPGPLLAVEDVTAEAPLASVSAALPDPPTTPGETPPPPEEPEDRTEQVSADEHARVMAEAMQLSNGARRRRAPAALAWVTAAAALAVALAVGMDWRSPPGVAATAAPPPLTGPLASGPPAGGRGGSVGLEPAGAPGLPGQEDYAASRRRLLGGGGQGSAPAPATGGNPGGATQDAQRRGGGGGSGAGSSAPLPAEKLRPPRAGEVRITATCLGRPVRARVAIRAHGMYDTPCYFSSSAEGSYAAGVFIPGEEPVEFLFSLRLADGETYDVELCPYVGRNVGGTSAKGWDD